MKKVLISLFLILGASSFALDAGKVEVKGALDLGGQYKPGNAKAKFGAGEIGVEYRNEVMPGLEVGAGTAYQFHKDVKDGGKEFDSVPLYATAKYSFDTQTTFKPYVKADLGYSFNTKNKDFENAAGLMGVDAKTKNGLYYGVGGGVSFNNVNVELMYKENKGKYEVKSSSFDVNQDVTYKRVTLGVGYTFGF